MQYIRFALINDMGVLAQKRMHSGFGCIQAPTKPKRATTTIRFFITRKSALPIARRIVDSVVTDHVRAKDVTTIRVISSRYSNDTLSRMRADLRAAISTIPGPETVIGIMPKPNGSTCDPASIVLSYDYSPAQFSWAMQMQQHYGNDRVVIIVNPVPPPYPIGTTLAVDRERTFAW